MQTGHTSGPWLGPPAAWTDVPTATTAARITGGLRSTPMTSGWLNLHRYLYVLARAHNRTPDASQPAVAGVLEDEQQGLATLSDEERGVWNASGARGTFDQA